MFVNPMAADEVRSPDVPAAVDQTLFEFATWTIGSVSARVTRR